MIRRTVCCLACALTAAATPAAAQTPSPDRWLRPVAVAAPSRSGSQLQMDWSALAAADDNLAADTAIASDPRGRVRARGGSVDLSPRYRRTRPHTVFSVSAFARATAYDTRDGLNAVDRGADVGVGADLGRATKLAITQSWRQQPVYQFTVLAPSAASAPDADLMPIAASDTALSRSMGESFAGSIALDRAFGPKWHARTSYGYRGARLASGTSTARSQSVNGGLTRALTRFTGLRLGYGYATTSGSFGAAPPASGQAAAATITTHDLDVGLAYDRPLSATRRTSFTFGSGASLTPAAGRTYTLLLDAGVARAFGRAWAATGNYHRGVTLVDGFATFAFADVATVAIGGFATTRLSAGITGARSYGRLGTGATAAFTTDAASAEVRFAIARRLTLVSRYAVYHYVFGEQALLPTGFGRSSVRQSVRVGVSGSFANVWR